MSALLRISSRGVDKTLVALREAGSGHNESCAFWLGDPTTARVERIIVPHGAGVVFRPLSITISEAWMDRLGALTDETGLVVLGAAHTHPDTAFFSPIDADAFFHAPDCVSVVVPNYGGSTLTEADGAWGTFVGLPFNEWRASRWSDEVVTDETLDHEVQRLSIDQ